MQMLHSYEVTSRTNFLQIKSRYCFSPVVQLTFQIPIRCPAICAKYKVVIQAQLATLSSVQMRYSDCSGNT